jgi:phosphorylase kinase gamma subunit
MYDSVPGYGREVDMWACGVILFTLLSGSPPFWHRKQQIMLRTIMSGTYTFSSPEWDDISDHAKDLIRNLLVVNPTKRYTAEQALSHPFFQRDLIVQRTFFPRKTFRVYILAAMTILRLKTLHNKPQPIKAKELIENPYRFRVFRKTIDTAAFTIYGHWVKRGEQQNRAALFENEPKCDLKSLHAARSGNGGNQAAAIQVKN